MSKADIELYYNEKVIAFLEFIGSSQGLVKVFMAGRGSGKTRSIPEDILDRAHALPRARVFLTSYSFDAINDNIMPDIREVFELHGFKEGYDYVVDRHPPLDFEKPYKKIEDPRNSIHLFNGFCIQKISMGRIPKKNRGKSYDGGLIDEALNLKGHDVDNILLPTLRGIDHWDSNPYWKMLSIYSSYPRDPEGSWFLRYKELAKRFPELYGWFEANALDNLAVLGEEYIENQRAALSHYDFMIEIMNKGDTKDLPSLFYHKYTRTKHNYRASGLSDVHEDMPLELSFDFGGRYSCLLVSQEQNGVESMVHEFDTNNVTDSEKMHGKVKKVPDLINDFSNKFKDHRNRTLRVWGDRTGLNREAMDNDNNYAKIQAQLMNLGWEAEIMVSYADAALHKSRYNFLNDCFEGVIEDYPSLQINELTCPNLCTSLDLTRVKDDFKKDKKDERNQFFNQSHAPHLTDCLDYKIYNKYFYLLEDDGFGLSYGSIGGGIEGF